MAEAFNARRLPHTPVHTPDHTPDHTPEAKTSQVPCCEALASCGEIGQISSANQSSSILICT
jgi:hypothetical protein